MRLGRMVVLRGPCRNDHRQCARRQGGRLVLVTCEDWNGEVYLSNAVVIAEPVR
jgi:hypothetical protein